MSLLQPRKVAASRIRVGDLNQCLTCPLCRGYFIDATTLVDCLHTFCRACILRYFENFKLACPTCNIVYKKKNWSCLRPDAVVQSLVYKLVPGLYGREVQRREDFYRSTGVRAGSSCSEDSVLGDLGEERDGGWMSASCPDGDQFAGRFFFSPDDSISLSLEFYRPQLDGQELLHLQQSTKCITRDSKTNNSSSSNSSGSSSESALTPHTATVNGLVDKVTEKKTDSTKEDACEEGDRHAAAADRRYLRCPAAVTMSHLQKFLRMKHALSVEHRVDVIYLGEVLPPTFSLMDVAYTFNWKRIKPMRFFFRIFTPAKIQPIKIINTSSTGEKQLQVVLSKSISTSSPVTPPFSALSPAPTATSPKGEPQEPLPRRLSVDSRQNDREKERLMANLQLQSKSKVSPSSASASSTVLSTSVALKVQQNGDLASSVVSVPSEKSYRHKGVKFVLDNNVEPGNCIYEYEEPDKDEIRAFAEKRDREWALQKKLDEEEREKHRTGKKRKKNKHSKGNVLHKKRKKLHAEITSNESLQSGEDSLKLKVKLTTSPHNGYKHKHHKSSSGSSSNTSNTSYHSTESPVVKIAPTVIPVELSSKEKLLQMRQVRHKQHVPQDEKANKRVEDNQTSKGTQVAIANSADSSSSIVVKDVKPKIPTVKIERHEQTERRVQNAVGNFVKTLQNFNEKLAKETTPRTTSLVPPPSSVVPKNNNNNFQTTKLLEQKMANLHNQKTPLPNNKSCSVQAVSKNKVTTQKRTYQIVNNNTEKPAVVLNSQYAGSQYTVSKVESGVKKKQEERTFQEKYPSLEITLINPSPPPAPVVSAPQVESLTALKQQLLMQSSHPVASVLPPKNTIKSHVKPQSPVPKQQPHQQIRPAARSPVTASKMASPGGLHQQPHHPSGTKRPMPATIPLEKIKKSMQRVSTAVTIIPKSVEEDNTVPKRDTTSGPLDLTKPNKIPELTVKLAPINTAVPTIIPKAPVALNNNNNGAFQNSSTRSSSELSNLQMLSKVATEHLIKAPVTSGVKRPAPQMPNLHTLKIPSLMATSSSSASSTTASSPLVNTAGKANLAKLPKLNEISKTQFRLPNMRPNQNQTIRNIPNPSLLVRNQSQNRLLNPTQSQTTSLTPPPTCLSPSTTPSSTSKSPPHSSTSSSTSIVTTSATTSSTISSSTSSPSLTVPVEKVVEHPSVSNTAGNSSIPTVTTAPAPSPKESSCTSADK